MASEKTKVSVLIRKKFGSGHRKGDRTSLELSMAKRLEKAGRVRILSEKDVVEYRKRKAIARAKKKRAAKCRFRFDKKMRPHRRGEVVGMKESRAKKLEQNGYGKVLGMPDMVQVDPDEVRARFPDQKSQADRLIARGVIPRPMAERLGLVEVTAPDPVADEETMAALVQDDKVAAVHALDWDDLRGFVKELKALLGAGPEGRSRDDFQKFLLTHYDDYLDLVG